MCAYIIIMLCIILAFQCSYYIHININNYYGRMHLIVTISMIYSIPGSIEDRLRKESTIVCVCQRPQNQDGSIDIQIIHSNVLSISTMVQNSN